MNSSKQSTLTRSHVFFTIKIGIRTLSMKLDRLCYWMSWTKPGLFTQKREIRLWNLDHDYWFTVPALDSWRSFDHRYCFQGRYLSDYEFAEFQNTLAGELPTNTWPSLAAIVCLGLHKLAWPVWKISCDLSNCNPCTKIHWARAKLFLHSQSKELSLVQVGFD